MKPSTHDYRNPRRTWGWDIHYTPEDGGQRLRAGGWGKGLSAGDFLLLSNNTGGSTRYRVGDDLRYEYDPPDQWFATLHFAPRQEAVSA